MIIWFETLIVGYIFGYVAAFILSLARKWSVVEYYDTRIRRAGWSSFCYFCAAWWICFLEMTVFIMYGGEPFHVQFLLTSIIGCIVAVKKLV